MYGNQTHFLLSQSATNSKIKNLEKSKKRARSSRFEIMLILTVLCLFNLSANAGSKNPKLAGGNGNAKGRVN